MNRREALKAALALPLVGLVPAVSKPQPQVLCGTFTWDGRKEILAVTEIVRLRSGQLAIKTRTVATA